MILSPFPSRVRLLARAAVLGAFAITSRAGGQSAAPAFERPIVDLPFYYFPDSSHLSVPMHAAGRDSIWMIVDAGAQYGVILPSAREAFGPALHVGGATTVNGAAGSDVAESGSLDSIRVDTVMLRDLNVNVYDFMHVIHEPPTSPPVGGILGRDVLRSYDVEFDFPSHRMRWYGAPNGATTTGQRPPTRWAERPGFVCVPNLANEGPEANGDVVVEMTVNGRKTYGYFDTGAGRTVIGGDLADALGLKPEPGAAPAGTGTGVGGDKNPFYWVNGLEFEVGPTKLRSRRVTFGALRLPPVPTGSPSPAVLLGLSSINDRVFVLAYRTNEVCFGPRAPGAAPKHAKK